MSICLLYIRPAWEGHVFWFFKKISLNWIANADGPNPFNATHFFDGSEIDPPISVKLCNRINSSVMLATEIKHKEEFSLKLAMHSYVDLLVFVKLKMSLCCLSNSFLSMRD